VTAAPSPGTIPPDVLANPRLGSWISVTDEGLIGVRVGKVELGQGILTTLAQIAADALGIPVSRVRMLAAHTLLGPDEGLTAGSMSTAQAGSALRYVGAAMRALVAERAATTWRVPPDDVRVNEGEVRCGDRSAPFAQLARSVALDTDLLSVRLRDRTADQDRARRAVGASQARLDLPDKVLGRPHFIADLRPEGLRFGRVVRPPSPGARLVDLDETRLRGMEVDVVRDGSFLGLVAASEDLAERAVAELRAAATWHEQDLLPDEDELAGFLRAGPHDEIEVLSEAGSLEGPPAGADTVHGTYSRPFLVHASIAPSCGVARWDDGRLHVWSHSQGIHRLRDAIAAALALTADEVVVEHVENAGCYGHNAADDAAFDAVLLARAVPGVPVQVRWSRQDELTGTPGLGDGGGRLRPCPRRPGRGLAPRRVEPGTLGATDVRRSAGAAGRPSPRRPTTGSGSGRSAALRWRRHDP